MSRLVTAAAIVILVLAPLGWLWVQAHKILGVVSCGVGYPCPKQVAIDLPVAGLSVGSSDVQSVLLVAWCSCAIVLTAGMLIGSTTAFSWVLVAEILAALMGWAFGVAVGSPETLAATFGVAALVIGLVGATILHIRRDRHRLAESPAPPP